MIQKIFLIFLLSFLQQKLPVNKFMISFMMRLPYNATVETEIMKKSKSGTKTPLNIEQTIFVTRDAHKRILVKKDKKSVPLGNVHVLNLASFSSALLICFSLLKSVKIGKMTQNVMMFGV